ncbi:MAG: hypothetical protein II755_08220 [Prevotella sp.]|nr:hypothetical protein [Prevotella sp.]
MNPRVFGDILSLFGGAAMQENYQTYTSAFSERYPSKEMKYLFSPEKKFTTWRKLWIALAESEKELGLPITDEQIAELKAHAGDINYDVAKAREKVVRHDVMSHVYAYGEQCPAAKGIQSPRDGSHPHHHSFVQPNKFAVCVCGGAAGVRRHDSLLNSCHSVLMTDNLRGHRHPARWTVPRFCSRFQNP